MTRSYETAIQRKTGRTDLEKILEKGLSTADIQNWNGPKYFFDTFTEPIEHVAYKVAPSDMKKKRPPWFEMSADELLDAIGIF